MVLVSVIMSVHNAELHVLKKSVESIVIQDFTNLEFIVINDINNSMVNNYLDNLSNKDSRIFLINNEENIGLTKSLIKGIKCSKGKYIARQDADDISYKDRLKLQVDFMEKNPGTSLIGTWYLEEAYGKYRKLYTYSNDKVELKERLFFSNPICHTSAMFTRYHYDSSGGYNSKYETCQDLDLWFRLAKLGDIGIIEKKLVIRKLLKTSLSSSIKAYNQAYNAFRIRLKNVSNKKKNVLLVIRVIESFIYHLIMTVIAVPFRYGMTILNKNKFFLSK